MSGRGTSGCACACAQAQAEAQVAGLAENAPKADTSFIIVAGGSGERFGDPRGKQFVELCGLPMLAWSLVAADLCPSVAEIVIVCAENRLSTVRDDVLSRITITKPVTLAPSGATRQESAYSGLRAASVSFGLVAIHDAARPLVEPELVERALACVRTDTSLDGAILAVPCTSTLKVVSGTTIVSTPARDLYWEAQTPQVFRREALMAANRRALREGIVGTDDASLVERAGGTVAVVESTRDNIKITLPEDLALAEAALERRLIREGCGLE